MKKIRAYKRKKAVGKEYRELEGEIAEMTDRLEALTKRYHERTISKEAK